jgi:serine/threonine-protein kinase
LTEPDEIYPSGYRAAGRYELSRRLGVGGMGAVYEAFDVKVDRPVAVKILARGLASDPELRMRFEREAKAAGRIDHDNVCSVLDWGITDEGVPFLVMELLRGEPLEQLCQRQGTVPHERAVELMLQVLSALAAAHAQGIVHRDLKPENIFLVRTSDGAERIKLLDFGIAKFIGSSQKVTKQGIILGTLQYMSPEQAMGAANSIDHRTDIWAAGVILYEMLAGRAPFQRETVPESLAAIINDTPPRLVDLVPSVPRAVSDAVERAMAKKPEARFASAPELAAALRGEEPPAAVERLVFDESTWPTADRPTPGPTMVSSPNVTALATTTTSPVPTPTRIRSILIALVVAVGLIGGAIVVVVGVGGDDAGVPATVPIASTVPPGPAEPPPVATQEPVAVPPVVLRLVGLPDGARVSFDGAELRDARVAGLPGRSGELLVEAPGYRDLRLPITLATAGDLDLASRLERSEPADAGPAKNTPEADGGSGARRRGRTKRILGKHGPSVITDYRAQ